MKESINQSTSETNYQLTSTASTSMWTMTGISPSTHDIDNKQNYLISSMKAH